MAKHAAGADRVFTALADPTRRGMIERLSRGPASVSELAEPYGIALPTAVRHLGVLADAGLVTTRKRGRVRMCSLERGALAEVADWIDRQRRTWTTRLDALERTLDEGDHHDR